MWKYFVRKTARMVLSLAIIKVTLLMILSGVISEDIESLSDASISKAIGENATIAWIVKGIRATTSDDLSIFIIKGELTLANVVFKFAVYTANSTTPAKTLPESGYKELASRSTANYTYTGKSSDGQGTARVSFTINNLILGDEGSYVLVALALSSPTNISVNFGPERCGIGLRSENIVTKGDQFMITSGFCGKPQPTVTCTFNGTPLKTVVITEVSQYNYSYAVDIPNLTPCDRRELRCTVTGYGKPFTDSTIVHGEYVNALLSKLNEKEEEMHSKSILIIVLGVVTVLFSILTIMFIMLVKIGKIKIELFQKRNAGNVNQEHQENIQNVNTAVKPPSDNMELQAARKDTTYQALTSVPSTPVAGTENSAYKENIQVKPPSDYMELQAARKDTTYQAIYSNI